MKKILIIIFAVLAVAASWWFTAPTNYYEYEVADASECLDGESYDSEHGICYFDFYCETDQECQEIDDKFETVLADLDEISDDVQHSDYGDDREGKELEAFVVVDGELNQAEEGLSVGVGSEKIEDVYMPVDQVKSAWELFKSIVPQERLVRFGEYVEWSDGVDGELASVEVISEDGSIWKLSVDPKDAYKKNGEFKDKEELVATLVHEYAHVLTLNDSQQEFSFDTCASNQFETFEGCAFANSYLKKFVDQFWSVYLDEFLEIEGNEDEEEIFDFYLRNENDFVNDYAATNPGEDIAESFAYFVTTAERSTATVADQKIDFFYSYPELVELRNFMRGRIAHFLSQ
jgi:hypothetical protein